MRTKAFAIFISATEPGDYNFLGYTAVNNQFTLYWKQNNIFAGGKPFVKIMVIGDNGYSDYSNVAQIQTAILTASVAADIQNFIATPTSNSINLTWTSSNVNYDYFQIYRYKSDINSTNNWEFLGNVNNKSFSDNYALKTVNYHYAIRSVYKGDCGIWFVSDTVTIPSLKANLYLHEMTYYYGNIGLSPAFTIDVWNIGATNINNYSIYIWAYDIINDTVVNTPVAIGTASSLNAILPLQSGYKHTVSFQLNLTGQWPKYYYWIISINSEKSIDEEYYADNILFGDKYWYIASQLRTISYNNKAIQNLPADSFISSSDPYRIINSNTLKKSISNNANQKIIYQKPEININKYHSN